MAVEGLKMSLKVGVVSYDSHSLTPPIQPPEMNVEPRVTCYSQILAKAHRIAGSRMKEQRAKKKKWEGTSFLSSTALHFFFRSHAVSYYTTWTSGIPVNFVAFECWSVDETNGSVWSE